MSITFYGKTNVSPWETTPYVTLIGSGFIGVGLIPVPLVDPALPAVGWLEYCIAVLPTLPFFIFIAFAKRTIPTVPAIVLAIAIFLIGAMATLFMMPFSGGGATMVAVHGLTLVSAIAASVILVSTCGRRVRILAKGIFTGCVCLGVWSLSMVPIAHSQATKIAKDRPFCIAAHGPKKRELTSFLGLRGFSFYTTLSGYKIENDWFLHGLLLVAGDDDDEPEVYNWSPRAMSFRHLEAPQRLFASPKNACQPQADFLKHLPFIS